MKKQILLATVVVSILYVAFSSYSTTPAVSGVDGTGAQGGAGCSCHGSVATTVGVTIELDSAGIPVTHYIGGNSYTIKITGTNSTGATLPYFGFQVTAVKLAGAGTGTAIYTGTLASTGLPTSCSNDGVSSGTFRVVEHSTPIIATTGTGGAGTTYMESIPWTAPVSGTGSIKLYGVINAINHDFSTSGDFWNRTNTTITELIPGPAPITGTLTLCAGTTVTLTDATTGGTWSSSNPSVASIIGSSSVGVVTGVSGGTAVISYTTSGGTSVATVTVNPLPVLPAPITGASTVCVSSTITLADTSTGGTWSSGSTGIATVSTSGVVSGVSTGIVTISYTRTNSCGSASATKVVTVNTVPATPAPITGTFSLCTTSPCATLGDTTAGGTWTSSNPAIAAIGATTGIICALAAGNTTITYTVTNSCGSASVTAIVTVGAAPAAPSAITGTLSLCVPSTSTLADVTTGGVWSSTTTSIATISSTGTVTAVTAGTTLVSYTVTNSCGSSAATALLTVNPAPDAGVISGGSSSICVGSTATFTDTAAGGTWSSSNPAVATVSSSGVVIGVSAGSDTIRYTRITACGTASVYTIVTITTFTTAGSISGGSSVCVGSTLSLTDGVAGGTWGSSNATALVSGAGIVTGVMAGVDTINYTVVSSCGTAIALRIITINPLPAAGAITVISGSSTACVGANITLVDTTTGGTWSSDNIAVATVSGGVVLGVSAGTAHISYTVTGACGSASAVQTVNIIGIPTVSAIAGSSSVCTGTTVTLSDSATGGTWLSTSSSIASVSSSGVVSGLALGIDSVVYYITNACGTASAHHFITVNAAPATAGSISGSDSVCVGNAITLTDTTIGGVWSASNALAAVSGDVVAGIMSSGWDTIVYTVSNSCGSVHASHSVFVRPSSDCWPVGVIQNNHIATSGLHIYPNPATDVLFVETDQSATVLKIEILDLLGNVITNFTALPNFGRATLDLNGIPQGNYLIKIAAGTNIYREKITLMK